MKPFWSEVIREGRWFSRRLAHTFAIILASEFISEIGRYDPHFMWGLSGFRISVGLSRYQNYDFDTIPAKISRYPILTIRYHKYDTILQLRYDTTNTIPYHKYDKILVYLSMIVINKTSVRFPFLPACSCPACLTLNKWHSY